MESCYSGTKSSSSSLTRLGKSIGVLSHGSIRFSAFRTDQSAHHASPLNLLVHDGQRFADHGQRSTIRDQRAERQLMSD